jgi:hypothetical protein
VDLEPLAAPEAELTRLHCRICLTDYLIDLLTYKLLGLTKEEITIM